MSDDLIFSDEAVDPAPSTPATPWHILIVDDERGVHDVTKLVMAGFQMDGRPLEFFDCYSAAEARALLAQPNDIALILLDVVMESDTAGLDLARHIREDLGNLNVRIVLRTGQAGQAPEEQVIRDYDINDYKEKTELTRRKLITVFYAALRAYRDLMRIARALTGLRRSVDAITRVCDSHSLITFASAVLEQVNYLLNFSGQGLCASRTTAYTASSTNGRLQVLAATDGFSGLLGDKEIESLPADVRMALSRAMAEKTNHYGEHHYVAYYQTKSGSESVIYMQFVESISSAGRELLELFSANVAITYDNLLLREEIEATQRATIAILSEAIEGRYLSAQPHGGGVAQLAALMATWLGQSDQDIDLIRQAASLHDVGKIRISSQTLSKPGPLDTQERATVNAHAQHGFDLLARSNTRVHQLAAQMALEHHERWDGSGYPNGLAGEQISHVGRLVAIADVLDALINVHFYKEAWTLSASLAYLKGQSGLHFEPALVSLVLAHRSEVADLYGLGGMGLGD